MELFTSMLNKGGGSTTVTTPYDTVEVGIIASQSNLANRNEDADRPANISSPNPTTLFWQGVGFSPWTRTNTSVEGSGGWSANVVLAQKLYEFTGDITHIVQRSRGGTAFYPATGGNGDWNVNSIEPTDHFWVLKRSIINTLEWGRTNNKVIHWRWLWVDIMETDANISQDSANQYEANFLAFVSQIRSLTKNPNLPVIFRRLAPFEDNTAQPYYATVRAAQDNIAATLNNCFMINADGYTGQDASHLDAASSLQYGEDVFQVIKNNIIAAS